MGIWGISIVSDKGKCVIGLVFVKEVFGVTEILGLGWHLFLRMRHDARITPIVAHNTRVVQCQEEGGIGLVSPMQFPEDPRGFQFQEGHEG